MQNKLQKNNIFRSTADSSSKNSVDYANIYTLSKKYMVLQIPERSEYESSQIDEFETIFRCNIERKKYIFSQIR